MNESTRKQRHAFAISEADYQSLKLLGRVQGVTASEILREAITEYLENHAEDLEKGRALLK